MGPEHLSRFADVCAGRLPASITTETLSREPAFQDLLNAIRKSDPRFAFEREGRPDAIAAVRAALPTMERDLFDAIIDDLGCEVAALSEATVLLVEAVAKAQRA